MKNTDLKQISELLDNKLDNKLSPIQKTLSEHSKILESHDKRFDSIDRRLGLHDTALESIGKTLKSNGKLLKALKKDQNTMLGMLDEEQMKQRRKIKRVEDHLGLTSPIS